MAELAEFGGHIPNGEARMSIENGIDIPALSSSYGHQGLVTCLSPCPNVLSSLLESSSQSIGSILIKAMKCIAMHVVSHFWLVYVACPCFLCVPEHLIRHLHIVP
ncbi:unnamed protein product [Withania somnifera]